MANLGNKFLIALALTAGLLSGFSLPHAAYIMPAAHATRLSPEMSASATGLIKGAKVRLDGGLETADGTLFLPLMPATVQRKGKADLDTVLPDKEHPNLIFYTNGWAHIRLGKKGDAIVLDVPSDLSDKLKKRLLSLHFPSDLIVPQGLVLPRSYRPLTVDVPSISLVDDIALMKPDFGKPRKVVPKSAYKGNGSLFLTSITAGSITMLDGKTLNKIAEFPTEGTPCGMELVNGMLYIADQAKNRVLILDPVSRKFTGQIDLPPHSAPKAIAVVPDGKWMYVSSSGTGEIAVIETATGKVLVRTKVRPGPGSMVVTPDGIFLIVLNVTSGEVTEISTYNQKVVGTVKVGDMPTSLILGKDGRTCYVTNRMSNSVSVIDLTTRKLMGTIKCGQSPTGVALSQDGTKLYVANGRDNTIAAYDTKTLALIKDMHLPTELEFPGSLCLLPDGHHLIVSSQANAIMAIVDTDKMELEKQASLGHANHQAVWEPVP